MIISKDISIPVNKSYQYNATSTSQASYVGFPAQTGANVKGPNYAAVQGTCTLKIRYNSDSDSEPKLYLDINWDVYSKLRNPSSNQYYFSLMLMSNSNSIYVKGSTSSAAAGIQDYNGNSIVQTLQSGIRMVYRGGGYDKDSRALAGNYVNLYDIYLGTINEYSSTNIPICGIGYGYTTNTPLWIPVLNLNLSQDDRNLIINLLDYFPGALYTDMRSCNRSGGYFKRMHKGIFIDRKNTFRPGKESNVFIYTNSQGGLTKAPILGNWG